MNAELNRLQTFCNWPTSAPVSPTRIAKAGFYYTGVGLEVKCFCCSCKISSWDYGDQVMWRHRQLKPNCPFVLNPTNSDNIPMLDVFESNEGNQSTRWNEEPRRIDDNSHIDYGLTEEDEMYRSDALRLLSYINWDDSIVRREALVNAGFYHVGEGRLRCAWCGGELTLFTNITEVGDPIQIHRMYFPRCDHAATVEASQRANAMNMPSPPASPPTHTPTRSPVTRVNKTSTFGAAHNSRILNAGSTWRALGVVGSGARHPHQTSLSQRLASFSSWPADRTQSPRDMAEAGFFHTGIDDQVRCFYCDGGLGRWESGDAPWSEHARWFPTCGYVLLVKGQEFIEECRERTSEQTTVQSPSNPAPNGRNPGVTLPVTENQIDEYMESAITLGALGAGLDAARVRRAIAKRLRTIGVPFTTSEALIDAVLDDQLNEESWSVSTQSQRFARDILAETLRELVPSSGRSMPQQEERPDSTTSESDRTRTPSPNPVSDRAPSFTRIQPGQTIIQYLPTRQNQLRRQNQLTTHNQPVNRNQPTYRNQTTNQNQPVNPNQTENLNQPTNQNQPTKQNQPTSHQPNGDVERAKKNSEGDTSTRETRHVSLEEENRQLKEARLCKVCMDSEVSVVFLPCGHLVSCAGCGAALSACPLCRSAVRALVRAYLA